MASRFVAALTLVIGIVALVLGFLDGNSLEAVKFGIAGSILMAGSTIALAMIERPRA
ncbi:MAG TPA: hypothetical protein VFE46_15960 [Pirellulales bacterium]|jgi:hypothetical protein|nr:hypothetical protein [Pirellulales bacterium]